MDKDTKQFYDEFWPKNVQHYKETKRYMMETISEREIDKVPDAVCGHGVCSVVLSEMAD